MFTYALFSKGFLQQLRNQEEGRIGACGQVQQINMGPKWFWLEFWGWNKKPPPTGAYTWKYLLVHSNRLLIFGNSCILAETLVEVSNEGKVEEEANEEA